MKDIKLTKKEQELILSLRAKEDCNVAKKTGVLKEDLYYFGELSRIIDCEYEFITLSEVNKIIKKLKAKKAVSAGDIFDCYIEEDGNESWYDRIWGIEGMSEEWARKYLKGIKNV
jgi:hypothetical protein